uniref:7TM_GPCR_Srx domain-containing protein n=1 Tax=Steinernema glaseri TaxID=37863 RepID=A0A1I7ZRI7_9BILA
MTGSVALSKVQRQVSIQACVICSFICLAGGIYVVFEFLPELASPIFIIVDFLCWQWGFCGVITSYMLINKTLRRGVLRFYLRMFGYGRDQEETTAVVSHVVPKSSSAPLA